MRELYKFGDRGLAKIFFSCQFHSCMDCLKCEKVVILILFGLFQSRHTSLLRSHNVDHKASARDNFALRAIGNTFFMRFGLAQFEILSHG